jgi:putative addiction module CopG family antidote
LVTIALKKQFKDWIAGQVSSGRYASELEAIEDALAAKIEEEEVARLRARLKESMAQAERGETVPANEAFFERLYARIDEIEAKKRAPIRSSFRQTPKATSLPSSNLLHKTILFGLEDSRRNCRSASNATSPPSLDQALR